MDLDLFFPIGIQPIDPRAQVACARCPVRAECRQQGESEPHGVWGGQAVEQAREERRKERRRERERRTRRSAA